ncbi:MAG: citramalate synthase [Limnochordia bacterium]
MHVLQVELYDTTLRDGTQGEGISFSVEDKLNIVRRLDQLGIDLIEGGWPGSNPKDAEFFEQAKDLELMHSRLTAFGSTRHHSRRADEDPNLASIVNSGVKTAAIFGKSWDFHVREALRTTLEENLKMIEESIAFLVAQGLTVIYDAEHFFDGYKADSVYALETLHAAKRGGARTVCLCDTNGGCLPHEVYEITQHVRSVVDLPVGIHAHNDGGLGVANTLMAVKAGATHVQGTLNGYGERAGNADMCQIIPNLVLKMGYDCDVQVSSLTDLSRYVDDLANIRPDGRRPFVGRSVFTHKGGIHVSAMLRKPETYEHIDPSLVGNQRRVLVSELSGAGNMIYKAQEYQVHLEKGSTALSRVLQAVKELEHEGYTFEGAEGSFELLLKKSVGLYKPFFELAGLRVIIDKHSLSQEPVTEASIKVRIGDRLVHTVAEGEGPVHALDLALRRALGCVYPMIDDIHLTDYKVRVLNEDAGTSAVVRVLIESAAHGHSWNTVGVSANLIEASWRALVDSIEYGLMICEVQPQTCPAINET